MSVPNEPRSEGGERLPIAEAAAFALLQDQKVEALGSALVQRLYEHARYRLDGLLDLPSLGRCQTRLYRELDPDGRETGGGLQFAFTSAADQLFSVGIEPITHGVRVLGYRMADGQVRPEDPLDPDHAETLAHTVGSLGDICLKRGYVVELDLSRCEGEPVPVISDTAYSTSYWD